MQQEYQKAKQEFSDGIDKFFDTATHYYHIAHVYSHCVGICIKALFSSPTAHGIQSFPKIQLII